MATRYALERAGCPHAVGPGLVVLSGHSHIVDEPSSGPWSTVLYD